MEFTTSLDVASEWPAFFATPPKQSIAAMHFVSPEGDMSNASNFASAVCFVCNPWETAPLGLLFESRPDTAVTRRAGYWLRHPELFPGSLSRWEGSRVKDGTLHLAACVQLPDRAMLDVYLGVPHRRAILLPTRDFDVQRFLDAVAGSVRMQQLFPVLAGMTLDHAFCAVRVAFDSDDSAYADVFGPVDRIERLAATCRDSRTI